MLRYWRSFIDHLLVRPGLSLIRFFRTTRMPVPFDQPRRRGMIITGFIMFIIVLLSFTHTSFPSQVNLSQVVDAAHSRESLAALGIKKPQDISIVGFVFFGRKSRVEILKCYIEVRPYY